MTVDHVTAPGKIILCGEYAVLRDAPAIVMAIDRRATVSVTPHNERWCAVQTPGYANGTWRFEYADNGKIVWLDHRPSSGMQLLEVVFAQSVSAPITPAIISIDTSAFFDLDSGKKLGLGSSAAATVALSAALAGPRSSALDIWVQARRAHLALQGGSGTDIAASCFGGLLNYRQKAESPPPTLQWPESLAFRVFFSGEAASTRAAVEKADKTRSSDSAWGDLVSAAGDAATAWQESSAEGIISSMRGYTEQLQDFDNATDAGIFSAGHDELRSAGEAIGVAYKPCGAGGGDCGIAMSTDISLLDEFSSIAVNQGFVPLDVRRDNRGL